MSSHGFPINDLLRRRLQTALTVTTITLSVAATLFLLLYSARLGVGIAAAKGTLTLGLSAIFGQFLLFVGVLIFLVGAVLTSFIVFLMMAQRTRDFGLIKAAGCPNSLAAGYFMTELLTVTVVGCILGIIFGFLADFATASVVFGGYSLPNWWYAPIVFVAFFILSLVFGLQPLFKASKMSPIQALSPVNYYGTEMAGKHRALPHSALTWRLASRSLIRRPSATFRIVFLLSVVFVLLTVSVSGGIIAGDTTTSWIQKTVDQNAVMVAHSSMGEQYRLLLSKFTGTQEAGLFDYSDSKLAIPATAVDKLGSLSSVSSVDLRLVLFEHMKEIGNFTIPEGSTVILPVGDSREGDSLVIGVETQKISTDWAMKGRALGASDSYEAVIGDSITQSMFYQHPSRYVVYSDPLVESLEIQNKTFRIVGICVDPLNNGFVTYVPLDKLMNATGIYSPNLLMVKLDDSVDRNTALAEVRNAVQAVDSDLEVFDLSSIVAQDQAFLGSTWQAIMLLPTLSLASATICLVGYMMLSVEEQRQEFGMLRAVGAKPQVIVRVSAIQGALLILSSFGIGISFGVTLTILILIKNPIITSYVVPTIAVWLLAVLGIMLLCCIYPAHMLSKKPILQLFS